MHIIQVTPFFYPQTGGVENYVYNISRQLIEKGYRVTVLTSNLTQSGKILPPTDEIEGIEIRRFPVVLRVGRFAYLWPDFLKEAKKGDIIHVHVYRHPHTILSLFLKLGGKKIVMTTHSPFHPRKGWNRVLTFAFDMSLGWYWRLMDAIILTNDAERRFFNGEVLTTAVVDERFIRKDRKEMDKRILYLGRLDKGKNVEEALHILKELDEEWVLTIAGPETSKGYRLFLEKKVKELGLDHRVHFPGEVKREDRWEVLDKHGILILPSPYEAAGLVITEALARGLIPVVRRSPGPETIKRLCPCVKLYETIEEAVLYIKNARKCNCDLTPLTLSYHVEKLERLYLALTSQKP